MYRLVELLVEKDVEPLEEVLYDVVNCIKVAYSALVYRLVELLVEKDVEPLEEVLYDVVNCIKVAYSVFRSFIPPPR